MAIMKKCPVCEWEFKVTNWNLSKKFCSNKCKGLARSITIKRREITRFCAVCSKGMDSPPSQNSKFCSISCRTIGQTKKTKKVALSLEEKAKIKSHAYLKSIGEDPETSSLYK